MSINKTRAPRWELSIYVTNAMARSSLAVGNLRRLCDERIPARYRIRVVDLSKHPELSRRDEIVAVPTIVRHSPLPERRVIGTLSNTAGAAAALGLPDEKQWDWRSWWN